MMLREIEIVILLSLAMIVLLLVVGFDELIRRTTPRIIYVHSGGKADDNQSDTVPAA